MYNFFKKLYFTLPFKSFFFKLFRLFWSPKKSLAGYLKFKGYFNTKIAREEFRLYNNNSTAASILFWRGVDALEKQTMRLWLELSRESKVVFDVGANMGLFGIVSIAVNPDTDVHFFEPLERNAGILEKNLKANNYLARVNVCAVSNKVGEATLYDMKSEENSIASFYAEHVKSHKHHKEIIPIKVPTITLDQYIKSNNIDKVDLIKIDVEGAETEVLEGLVLHIKEKEPDVIIEILSLKKRNEIFTLFKSLNTNYNFYSIDEELGLTVMGSENLKTRNYFFTTKKALIN